MQLPRLGIHHHLPTEPAQAHPAVQRQQPSRLVSGAWHGSGSGHPRPPRHGWHQVLALQGHRRTRSVGTPAQPASRSHSGEPCGSSRCSSLTVLALASRWCRRWTLATPQTLPESSTPKGGCQQCQLSCSTAELGDSVEPRRGGLGWWVMWPESPLSAMM